MPLAVGPALFNNYLIRSVRTRAQSLERRAQLLARGELRHPPVGQPSGSFEDLLDDVAHERPHPDGNRALDRQRIQTDAVEMVPRHLLRGELAGAHGVHLLDPGLDLLQQLDIPPHAVHPAPADLPFGGEALELRDGEVVGAALTLPDYNQVLIHMNGRLLPFGWAKFLLNLKRIRTIRVLTLGIKASWRMRGLQSVMFQKGLQAALDAGFLAEAISPPEVTSALKAGFRADQIARELGDDRVVDLLQAGAEIREPAVVSAEALLKVLASPNVASKRWIYRQYDSTVRTNTIVGPGSDAAVGRVKGTKRALAMAGPSQRWGLREGRALAGARSARP